MITSKKMNSILEQIVKILSPNRIYLFGSTARQTVTVDSDLDVLIILPSNHPWNKLRRFERYGELISRLKNREIPIDAIILTEDELDTLFSRNEGEWDLIIEIVQKGELVYEAKEKIPH